MDVSPAERRGRDWQDLKLDPILEPTEAVTIQRSFFKALFGTFYEYLGSLVLLNLAVSAQLVLGVAFGIGLASLLHAPNGVGLGLVVVCGGLFVAPALAGLFSYVRAVCDPDSLSPLGEYVRGMRRFAVRSWLLLVLQAGSGGLLWVNLRFYGSMHSVVGLALSVVILMLSLLWAMAGAYAWPLLVRGNSWPVLLRNAFLLGLAAPFSTAGMLLGLGILSAVLIVIKVGWVILLFSAWALTENLALSRLVRIFRARQEAQAADEGSAGR